jgi:YihY family inner membrane protein
MTVHDEMQRLESELEVGKRNLQQDAQLINEKLRETRAQLSPTHFVQENVLWISVAAREAKWRWVSWGSAVATMVWIAASVLFSRFVSEFGNYDKSFGSLGAVIVLLTWLYLSAYVVLLGACLNAEMERQTARDTTRGPEKPMGTRGAKMADTVADEPG